MQKIGQENKPGKKNEELHLKCNNLETDVNLETDTKTVRTKIEYTKTQYTKNDNPIAYLNGTSSDLLLRKFQSFIQQIFIELLLYDKHRAKHQEKTVKTDTAPGFTQTIVWQEREISK